MNHTHTVIGMPGSGKTTFVAALWHLVTSREVKTLLALDRLDGDVTYLNEMVERWQRCELVIRTTLAEDHPLVLHLNHVQSGTPVVLHLTDLSGEKFEEQFATRTCEREYVSELNEGGGLLLFITADRVLRGGTIQDAEGLFDVPGEEQEWEPKFVSEDAQLVDLLLCIQQPPFKAGKRRLAVIISAWDVVANRDTAAEWLQSEMPLLAQFLASNAETFEVRAFGVSAQGGMLESDKEGNVVESQKRSELLDLTPSERIRCVEGRGKVSNDLTRPFCWLSGLLDD